MYLYLTAGSFLHAGTTNTYLYTVANLNKRQCLINVYDLFIFIKQNIIKIGTNIVLQLFFVIIVEIIILVRIYFDKFKILLKNISLSSSYIIDFIKKYMRFLSR